MAHMPLLDQTTSHSGITTFSLADRTEYGGWLCTTEDSSEVKISPCVGCKKPVKKYGRLAAIYNIRSIMAHYLKLLDIERRY